MIRRLAILGGSSAFLPALAEALAAEPDLPRLELRLFGRDARRTEVVASACTRAAAARGAVHHYRAAIELAEAIDGADIVVNQMRIGGFAGRAVDERLPLEHGLPGDESIGPGALASALRSVPATLAAADACARAAPAAWFVNLSNPMGILLRALQAIPALRAFGLCELPAVTLREAVRRLGRRDSDVVAEYAGLNHQGWFVRLEDARGDLLPALFDEVERTGPGFFGIDAAVMRELHALPLPYLRYTYHLEREVARQRARRQGRAEELAALSRELYAWYERAAEPPVPPALARRAMPWLTLAVAPAIAALLTGRPRELYVSERNGAHLTGVDPDAIVEKHAQLDADGARARATSARAEAFAPTIQRLSAFESAALRAALEPSRSAVETALELHPWPLASAPRRALAARLFESAHAAQEISHA